MSAQDWNDYPYRLPGPSKPSKVYEAESKWTREEVLELVSEEVKKARDTIINEHESVNLKEAAENDWARADMKRVLDVRYNILKKKNIPRILREFTTDKNFEEHFRNLGYTLDDHILLPEEINGMRNEFLETIENARLEKEEEGDGQCGCTIS